ncbi:uncharacterized protein PG986_006230 [Apiospora aurea]|uniref:SMP-30/Gluconolactonase/LRE-like region domain-containing protein n=1 Tax=Apiospora aurea TaxID=335848 RepID=A0ABR1QJU7_9PEZI
MCGSASIVKSIYGFPVEFVENLQTLSNGNLLLSTMESPTGLLYTLDPKAAAPQATLVTAFDRRVTALTGLSSLPGRPGEELYAVSGGLHTSFAFEKGSMAVHIVSVTDGKVVDSIPVPHTATMNGMAALPHHPHILLSADSIDGRILSIDTQKRQAGVLLKHDMLGAGAVNNDTSTYPVPPIGINGLRVRGDYLYFTNSNQGTFVRVRIDEYGRRRGDFEVLARSPDAAHIYDDFTFDQVGNAYIATHSSSIFKVTPRGVQTLLVGDGSQYANLLAEPTSATLALDGKCIYVSTGGDFTSSPRKGGQILQIPI